MQKNRQKWIKWLRAGLIVLGVVLAALLVLAATIYLARPKNGFIRLAERAIPFPAVMINGNHWVEIGDFEDNVDSTRRFYENQDFSQIGMRVDFNTTEGEKRLRIKEKQVLNKMIEDAAIEIIARRNGIVIDAAVLNENVDKRLEEYGNSQSVRETLERLYGWSVSDFKEKEVKPRLYQERLEAVFRDKYQQKEEARRKIEAARKEISENRRNFSDVVKEFSEGSSSQLGGELGWFHKSDIIPEIADQIFSLAKGEQSAVLESPLGFHIIELEDRRVEGKEELVKIRQIFTAKESFADWLKGQIQAMNVKILLRGYDWDREGASAKFSDAELEEFERRIREDPKGDASAIF